MDDKLFYLNTSAKYRQILEDSRKKYYADLDLKIKIVKNSKDWWKLATEIRSPQVTSGTELNLKKLA